MTAFAKDWLITPHDLAVSGNEIYVSGNLDPRIVVLNPKGEIQRYYEISKNNEYDNVCVASMSMGQVFAMSSRGLWELMPDGEARVVNQARLSIDHMTIGPEDTIYVSHREGNGSKISIVAMDGTVTELLTLESRRISDLEFDPDGILHWYDGSRGTINRYTPEGGIEIIASDLAESAGGSPGYLAFDGQGNLYTSTARYGLLMIPDNRSPAQIDVHATGDLIFYDGQLYALDIYTSSLYQATLEAASLIESQVLLDGFAPWSIETWDGMVVGVRETSQGRSFYNYFPSDPGRIEPHALLNELQPHHFTFDDAGNLYLIIGDTLKLVDSEGIEQFSITLPNRSRRSMRLHFNPQDDRVYYFDEISNYVMMADSSGVETFFQFDADVRNASLAITPTGTIYAAIATSSGTRIVNITEPTQQNTIWDPQFNAYWMHLGSSGDGTLYATFGPFYQKVLLIDPVEMAADSIVPTSSTRYALGFVDPSGFAVMDTGEVFVSAPGLLLEFRYE
jgi:hypothetical protein